MKGKYNMNTKGKIDFTKTDNIQFIEEVAREISKEDKNWQWEAREIKQHSLLLWWEYLEDEKQEGFRIEYDEAEEVFSVYDELPEKTFCLMPGERLSAMSMPRV